MDIIERINKCKQRSQDGQRKIDQRGAEIKAAEEQLEPIVGKLKDILGCEEDQFDMVFNHMGEDLESLVSKYERELDYWEQHMDQKEEEISVGMNYGEPGPADFD